MKTLRIFFVLFCIFQIISIGLSYANDIVAEVDGEPITWLEMQNRYELLWKDYLKDKTKYLSVLEETFHKDLKRIALNQLIDESLYLIYAEENNIIVSDQELETIFKEIYSNNDVFLSDGRFDNQKFQDFKNQHPDTYQQIINKIRDDVLDEKIRQIIKEQFQLTDNQLFDLYFRENSRIKLKYIVVPDSLMPEVFPATPAYLQESYNKNRKHYISSKKVKIKFFIIEDKDFYSAILTNINKIIDLDTSENYIEYIRDLAHERAREQAEKLISKLKWGLENERTLRRKYHIFETDYLQKGDKIGLLENSKNIVKFALRQKKGKFFSYPIEQEYGWFIFQTADIQKSHFADFSEAAPQCWNDYIKYGRKTYFDNKSENYYKENIENQDIYKVNISYILFNRKNLIFDINISPDSVASYYEKNIEDFVTVRDTLPLEKVQEDILEILVEDKEKILFDSLIISICKKVKCNDFNFSIHNSQIKSNVEFIKNIPYYESPFSLLADTIFTTQVDSIFQIQKYENILIGRVNKRESIKKSKIPRLKQVIEILMKEKWDNFCDSRFQKYYNANKDKYFTDDKFRVSYIYFPNDTSNIEVSEEEAIKYFQNNLEKIITPKKVKLETIFLPYSQNIQQTINNIQSAILDLVSFSILSEIYYNNHKMTNQQDNFLNYDQLDKEIRKVIDTLKLGGISSPIYTNEGCFIIKLIEKLETRVTDFMEINSNILSEIKFQRADSINFNNITTIFDSINSVNDSLLQKYEIQLHLSDYFVIKNDSILIDSFLCIRQSDFGLLRNTRIGRKVEKIFKVKNGYAILFLDNKIVGKKITGYESYALAREEFSQIVKYEECKIFTDYLAQIVKNHAKGRSLDNEDKILLSVFGGIKETDWLTYFDKVNNLKNSSIILRDAFSHDIGTYSHPIRFSDKGFGFYFIKDKKIVTRKDFILIKEQYREEYINAKFNEWFEDYKLEKQVKIFEN
ncbi:MAG: SurA N-terminal domain-containing protein [Candidatus Cloacimonetes bacterium]|nr:SurA N-terminal domain-containing protein [Candidatus Cloacimonadota bacterium]